MFNPTSGLDPAAFNNLMSADDVQKTKAVGALEKIVSSITVSDFSELLSRSNLLALIIFLYVNRRWDNAFKRTRKDIYFFFKQWWSGDYESC
jgi:hypothetical protein